MTWIIIGVIIILIIIIMFFIMRVNNNNNKSTKKFIKAIKEARASRDGKDTKSGTESKGFLEDFMRDNNLMRDISGIEKKAKIAISHPTRDNKDENLNTREAYTRTSPIKKIHKVSEKKRTKKFAIQDDDLETEWSRKLANDIRGTGRGENICKAALQDIYNVEFKKIRPKWLMNPKTKRNLEIDCYGETPNGDLIALEYQGKQHVEYEEGKGHYIKSEEEFKYQLSKDDFKKRMILKRGINFIEVHHVIPYELIGLFILDELRERRLL